MNKDIDTCDLSGILLIFGATGDLTHRKLMPALYNLAVDDLIPERFVIVATGRRQKTTDQYRTEVRHSIEKYSRSKMSAKYWNKLSKLIHYFQFDFTDPSEFKALNSYLSELDAKIRTCGNKIFYLAVAPQYFETIAHGLHENGLSGYEGNGAWKRLVIEKPFGKDLATARRLNRELNKVFSEKDIYRIDHYLGKEMIQNIMVLRFCNSIFESIWSDKFIDNIQISLNEKSGVGSRGDYYENSGAMRDMIQNHIMQILSLVAMEPPVNLNTESIRTEKLKVIQAIEGFTDESLRENVVFGQYGRGVIDGQAVVGYKEEENIPPDSSTETFVALKLHINNFRWSQTPFYIRSGKRMGVNAAEIVIQFKPMPNVLYFKDKSRQEPNVLVIKIQPNIGVFFQFNTKSFGTKSEIVPVRMDTSFFSPDQGNTPEAYERLLHDIMRGDTTLFSHWDEVKAAWMFADSLIAYREKKRFDFPDYDAGSMGPAKAFELLARDGREWWDQ